VFVTERQRLSDFKGRVRPAERLMDWMAVVLRTCRRQRRGREVDVAGFEKIDPRRHRVIRNGDLIPPPMKPEERESIRRGWGFGPEQLVIGCVANLQARKGWRPCSGSSPSCGRACPSYVASWSGEGSLRPELERLMAELNLAGSPCSTDASPMPAAALRGLRHAAHAAETEEVRPNAVVEAAAAGLPDRGHAEPADREIFVGIGESARSWPWATTNARA